MANNSVDIWSHLVTKAWAKLNGSYYNILHGKNDEFISDVTGFNCERVNGLTSGLFDIMKQEYHLGFVLMACPSEISRGSVFGFGSKNIWCSVVRICVVPKNEASEEVKLVLVRVPSAEGRDRDLNAVESGFRGKFKMNRGNGNWTQALRDELDRIKVDTQRNSVDDSGLIWVTNEEFLELFSEIVIFYNFHNKISQSIRLRHTKSNFSMVRFYINKFYGTMGVISLRQFDCRRVAGNFPTKKNSRVIQRFKICVLLGPVADLQKGSQAEYLELGCVEIFSDKRPGFADKFKIWSLHCDSPGGMESEKHSV
jgi:hypothetical protein